MKYYCLFFIFFIVSFSQAGFSCQDVLSSLSKWKKPRDTLKFIDIPRTNEEQELKRRGHREQFYAGVDTAHYLIQLGNALRENSIDPQRTHIENFVPLIARHFRHLKEGWGQYYGPTRLGPPKRAGLWASKINADMNYRMLRNRWASYSASVFALYFLYLRKTNQPLSLEAWQNLNLWWAILMQPRFAEHELYEDYFNDERPKQSIFFSHWIYKIKDIKIKREEEWDEEDFEQYSLFFSIPFPEKVILPTISPLGISAINRFAGGDQVIPVQLSNRVAKHDGWFMSPLGLFHNDISHIVMTNYGQPLLDSPLFHHHLMSYISKLPPKKREQAELIYFYLIHELPNFTDKNPSLEEITDKSALLKVLSTSFLLEPITYHFTPEDEALLNIEWDPNQDFFERQRIRSKKRIENRIQQQEEYMNSLPPEIRDFFNQTDIAIETIKNPQLLEESAEVFIQAVQHVLQHHPDIIQN